MRHRLGAEVLDHDVGDGDEPAKQRASLLGVHLEREVARAARQPAVHDRVGNAGRLDDQLRAEAVRGVAQHFRTRERFDLHHVGAELGEQEPGRVPGDERPEGEDAQLVDGAPATSRPGEHDLPIVGEPGHLGVVLAEAGRGATDPEQLRRRPERRAGHADVATVLARQGHEVVARRELLVLDELGRRVQDRARQAGGLAELDQLLPVAVGEEPADRLGETVVDLPPDEHVVERRIRELGRIVEHAQERGPVPGLVRGDVERPVAALPGAGGRISDRRAAIERHAHHLVAVEHEVLGRGDFVRRDVDRLAADRGAVLERGEDAHRRVRAGFVEVLLARDRERWTFGRADPVHRRTGRVRDEVRARADVGTDR